MPAGLHMHANTPARKHTCTHIYSHMFYTNTHKAPSRIRKFGCKDREGDRHQEPDTTMASQIWVNLVSLKI